MVQLDLMHMMYVYNKYSSNGKNPGCRINIHEHTEYDFQHLPG